MKKKREEETPDELGFTPSDYYDMQQLLDKNGKLNDTLLNGWDITQEQIKLINCDSHPLHSAAVIAFYDVNYERLYKMARGALASVRFSALISVISYEDLLQQLFCDLLGGWLKLPHDTKLISAAIYHCFRFAAVGGLEGVDNVKEFRAIRTPA